MDRHPGVGRVVGYSETPGPAWTTGYVLMGALTFISGVPHPPYEAMGQTVLPWDKGATEIPSSRPRSPYLTFHSVPLPHHQIALTEYSWGADGDMNGATAQVWRWMVWGEGGQ